MCSNTEILACTAQEIGIHVHGSTDSGLIVIGIAFLIVICIAAAQRFV